MKFFYQVGAVAIVCFLLQYFLPWWSMAIGAFAMGYAFNNGGLKSFVAGLLGVGLLWLLVSLYIDQTTHSILTEKIAKLLPLNPFLLTALVGGLVGGFSALTGASLRPGNQSKADYYR